MSQTFIEDCLSGNALPEDIDSYVAAWHDSDEDGVSLAERLGFTDAEYFRWVEDADYLPFIVAAHRWGTSVDQVLANGSEPGTRRSLTRTDLERLQRWLNEHRPAHSA